jgi:type III secretory pathway component EscS
MNFWNNIIRYPRFFLSSIIGLFLVLITSLLQTFRNISDKRILFCLIFFCVVIIILVVKLMLNLD